MNKNNSTANQNKIYILLNFVKVAHVMQKFEKQVERKVVMQEIACINGQVIGIKMGIYI